MSDAATPVPDGQPTVEHAAVAAEAAAAGSPNGAAAPSESPTSSVPLPAIADERPELVVGAAFAGGLVLALLLKRLAR
jgi:hypothetical protein